MINKLALGGKAYAEDFKAFPNGTLKTDSEYIPGLFIPQEETLFVFSVKRG